MQAPFRGSRRKFCLFMLKNRCAGKGARGSGERHTPLSPQPSHFSQKQLFKDNVWGTNCSHLPNICKASTSLKVVGFFPPHNLSTKSVTSTPSVQMGQCLEKRLCSLAPSPRWPDAASLACIGVKAARGSEQPPGARKSGPRTTTPRPLPGGHSPLSPTPSTSNWESYKGLAHCQPT